jgi:hypothetical protein
MSLFGRKKQTPHGHPYVWAFLTLLTFPVVLIASDMLGARGVLPFAYAILATLAVLAFEGLTRKRLWPFEPPFAECLGHPDTPLRIILFLGGFLLILETALLVIAATDLRLDASLVKLVMRKECGAHGGSSESFCTYLSGERTPDTHLLPRDEISYAIRMHAATAWFADAPLVTCAQRNMNQTTDTLIRNVSLVLCTSWGVDADGRVFKKSTVNRLIAAALSKAEDGLYRIAGWSENTNDASWDLTLGDRAETGRDVVRSFGVMPDLITIMQSEAQGRAQEMLRK